VAALRNLPPSNLLKNPGFEASAEGEEIPGWIVSRQAGMKARLDAAAPHEGAASLHLSSNGPVASLASEPFAPPRSGRLLVVAYLKVADETRQPRLRIAVEGTLGGRSYYRHAPVGAPPEATRPIRAVWEPFLFPLDNLPTSGLSQLRVRVDLMGAGEVWIDSLRLSTLHFTPAEQNELLTLLHAAQVSLQEGKLSSARRLLNGFWPRLLEQEVPAPTRASQDAPSAPSRPKPPTKPEEPPQTGLLDRAKSWLPRWMRF